MIIKTGILNRSVAILGHYGRLLLLIGLLGGTQGCNARNETTQKPLKVSFKNTADSLFAAKDYKNAQEFYQKALAETPQDTAVINGILRCEALLTGPVADIPVSEAPKEEKEIATPAPVEKTTPDKGEKNTVTPSAKKSSEKTTRKETDKEPAAPAQLPADVQAKVPETILVQGGTFKMGSNDGDVDEKPIHTVTVGSFYMSKYEVTVAQYREFCKATGRAMPATPKWGWHDNHPIVNVNWKDATAYCRWLSELTKQTYRLPTEAEWEYAARGGNKSKGYTYAGGNTLSELAWHGDNSLEQTHPVGTKKPNELGLYDMSGNVFEWCADIYSDRYYAESPDKNPKGPEGGDERILRGGSWYGNGKYGCRVAIRVACIPDAKDDYDGIRIVRSE